MFALSPSPEFRAKVPLSAPGAPQVLVEFTFRHRSKSALREWLHAGRPEAEMLSDVVSAWDGIADKGEPVPYSPAALATLLDNYPTAASEIFSAYMRELTEARTKNS